METVNKSAREDAANRGPCGTSKINGSCGEAGIEAIAVGVVERSGGSKEGAVPQHVRVERVVVQPRCEPSTTFSLGGGIVPEKVAINGVVGVQGMTSELKCVGQWESAHHLNTGSIQRRQDISAALTTGETPSQPLIAEPKEIIFEHFNIGAAYQAHHSHSMGGEQKRLKLKNMSTVPVLLTGLETWPREARVLRVDVVGWEGQRPLVVPGMSLRLLLHFTPDCHDEFHGWVRARVNRGQDTVVGIRAQRRHPWLALSPHENSYISQNLNFCNMLDCGICLNGSKVDLMWRIQNIGGGGKFLMLKNTVLSKDIKPEDSNWKEKELAMHPFHISPACFSVRSNSEVCVTNKFAPTEIGTYITNLDITSDNAGFGGIIVKGDSLAFEPDFVSIQDCEKSFQVTIEDDEDAAYYMDIGKILPFCEKRKTCHVINKSGITLKYRWELRDAVIGGFQVLHSQVYSSKIFWHVEPNSGTLQVGANIFCVTLSIEDIPAGKYQVIISLIVEGVPEESLQSNESRSMMTIRGSLETQTGGMVNLLVGEVEVWAECVLPLVCMKMPHLTFLPIPLELDKSFSAMCTILNGNEVNLHCTWRISEAIDAVGLPCEVVVFPVEASIAPNQAHDFEVCITKRKTLLGSDDRREIVILTFECYTWYDACNWKGGRISTCGEEKCNEGSGRAPGPSLRFCFCGLAEEVEVEILQTPHQAMNQFGIVLSGVSVERDFKMANVSNQDTVASISFFKGLSMLPVENLAGAFTLDSDSLILKGKSSSGVRLKFQPNDEESYRCLMVVRPSGVELGPSWDFSLIQGKGGSVHTAVEPATNRSAPLKLPPSLWPGMIVSLSPGSLSLCNLSSHESLVASFMWHGATGRDVGLMEASVTPRIGLLRPQETLDFSLTFFLHHPGEVKDYSLICYAGKKGVHHVFIKGEILRPSIVYDVPEEGLNSFSMENLISWGLCDKECLYPKKADPSSSIWEASCSENIISFVDVQSHQVQERVLTIKNQSPYTLEYKVQLKNFLGNVGSQKWDNRKSCKQGKEMPLEDKSALQTKYLFAQCGPQFAVTDAWPNQGTLNPWSSSEVKILFQSSTWGTYVEEVTVEFSAAYGIASGARVEVPPKQHFICVASVIGCPISFPAFGNASNSILRYNVVSMSGGGEQRRSVCIQNDTCLGIVLHCQVHFRLQSPSGNHGHPFQPTIYHFHPDIFSRLREIESQKGIAWSLDEIDASLKEILQREQERSLEVGLLPLLGPRADNVFKLEHDILFIPPHGKRELAISFVSNNCNQSCLKYRAVLIGHIHIALESRKSHCRYLRPCGIHLEPAMLFMEAVLSNPILDLRYEENELIEQFNIQKLFYNYEKASKLFEKRIIMENKSYGIANCQIMISKPFELQVQHGVRTVSQFIEPNLLECKIPSGQVIELCIKFFVTKKILREALEFFRKIKFGIPNSTANNDEVVFNASEIQESHLSINQELQMYHDNSIMKVVPLQIKFLFPLVAFSPEKVNFGHIPVKTKRKSRITVKNINDETVTIFARIDPSCKTFKLSQTEIEIPPKSLVQGATAFLEVIFQPQDAAMYKGYVIITLLEGILSTSIPISGIGFNDMNP